MMVDPVITLSLTLLEPVPGPGSALEPRLELPRVAAAELALDWSMMADAALLTAELRAELMAELSAGVGVEDSEGSASSGACAAFRAARLAGESTMAVISICWPSCNVAVATMRLESSAGSA